MEVTKESFEAMLIVLFKLEEYEACEKLLEVYKKYCVEENQSPLH